MKNLPSNGSLTVTHLLMIYFNGSWHWIWCCPRRRFRISCWRCIRGEKPRASLQITTRRFPWSTCTRRCPWSCFIRLVELHHILQGATYIRCLTFLQLFFLSVTQDTTLLGSVVLHGWWFYCRKEGRNINGLLRPPYFLWFCFSSCEIVRHNCVG